MASTSEQIPEQGPASQDPLKTIEDIAKEITPEDLMAGGKIVGILLAGFLKSMDAKDQQIKLLVYILTGIAVFLAAAAVGLQAMVP